MSEAATFDALIPAAMAEKAAQAGVKKAQSSFVTLFALGVLAGAFIAIGGLFSTVATAGAAGMLPYGVIRTIAGLAFGLGLIMVVVGGAELFTGNTLIVMAFASGKVSFSALLRNWAIVYAGNLMGAIGMAVLVHASGVLDMGDGAVGATAAAIAQAKLALDPGQAFMRGILCNILVCLAVWMCFAARSATGKVAVILFPVTAFVALGFEHSVANMYLIPVAMLHQGGEIDLFLLFANLVPVTAGNIIGGGLLVALTYWLIYLRPAQARETVAARVVASKDEPGPVREES